MNAASRIFSRIALGIAFAIAATIPIFAFVVRGVDNPETWTVAAAALAVITSVIAAWSSRRVLELQEDAQKPNPYPTFDMGSRHQLVLLRVKNTGGAAAHDISLKWDVDLINSDGKKIGFYDNNNSPGIAILLPGESISQIINVSHAFVSNHPDSAYTGHIVFQDPSGARYRKRFRLDGRSYVGAPSYDEESPRTHYQLQKIPEELKKL